MKDEFLGELGDCSRYDDQPFSPLVLPVSLAVDVKDRPTSASSSALYASNVLWRCSRRVRGAEEDSALMTSAMIDVSAVSLQDEEDLRISGNHKNQPR